MIERILLFSFSYFRWFLVIHQLNNILSLVPVACAYFKSVIFVLPYSCRCLSDKKNLSFWPFLLIALMIKRRQHGLENSIVAYHAFEVSIITSCIRDKNATKLCATVVWIVFLVKWLLNSNKYLHSTIKKCSSYIVVMYV